MAEFCSAGSNTISPPQWTSLSPPLTNNQSDKIAIELNQFLHGYWLSLDLAPEYDSAEIDQQSEKDRHAEDMVYNFANFKCACGTISEASVALLRELGFRTRLMRISQHGIKEIATHVFVEYYSLNSKKWVMFDAMENLVPKRNGKLMSALEYFLEPKTEDTYVKTGKVHKFAKSGYAVWFQKNGPIKKLFFQPI